MQPSFHQIYKLAIIAGGLLCLGINAHAAEQLVKSSEQFMHDKVSEVNFKFSRNLNFVQLYPGNLCKQCTLMMKLDSPVDGSMYEEIKNEKIKLVMLSGSLLQNASIKSDKYGSVTLTLNFTKIVSLEVDQGTSKKNIKISSSQYERPDERSAQENDLKNEDKQILPNRIFVVNLESSVLPLTLKKLDAYPELHEYKNYVTRIEFNNQRWYRHRIGFAATEEEAADLLVKVKPIFPESWIDTASPSEVGIARKYYSLYPDKLSAPKVAKTEKPANTPKSESAIKNTQAVTGTSPPVPDLAKALPSGKPPVDTVSVVPPIESEKLPIVAAARSEKNKAQDTNVPPEVTGGTDEKTRSLMERARQAMIDGNYELAISIYSKILASSDIQERKDAREYLGLARERNGQIAQARDSYTTYLLDFPSGPDADRVRQRLVGLVTAKAAPRQELVKSEKKKQDADWDLFNSFSQYYRNQNTKTDAPPTTTNATGSSTAATTDNSFSTDFSSNGRYRGERFDMRYQFNLNNSYNLLDTATKKDDTRISSAYYDVSDKETNMSYRVGRQSQGSYGIQGRFDGLFYSYRFDPKYKVNFVYGHPVDLLVTKGVNHTKAVTGLSVDLGTFADHWDMNTYIVEQTADGILDRKAVGAEVKYLSQEFTAFSILDYDINFKALNTALLFTSWRFKDNTSVNLNLDYRKSPMAMMSSGLNGVSGVTTLAGLLQQYSEATVRQLVNDRTANQYNAAASLNMPLTKDYQISADVSYSYTSSTPDSNYVSPPVAGSASSGNTFSYGGTLIGNSVIFDNDITIIGLRYSDAMSGSSWSVNANNRITLNPDWRLNPKFSINHQNSTDGSSRLIYRPGLRFEYKADKTMRFDVEVGVEQGSTKGGSNDGSKETNHFIYIGYIYDF